MNNDKISVRKNGNSKNTLPILFLGKTYTEREGVAATKGRKSPSNLSQYPKNPNTPKKICNDDLNMTK